jgi:benzoate/toluate 1,2-dioxygenase alpha subunit
MIVDQSPDGLEVLRGSSTYTSTATGSCRPRTAPTATTCPPCTGTTPPPQPPQAAERTRGQDPRDDAGKWGQQGGGFYAFDHGHMLLWTAGPTRKTVRTSRAATSSRFGEERADWMIQNSRNLCLYPNVYLMDQFSSQIRVLRPISVDRTEVTIYCIAPKGEGRGPRAPHPPVRGLLQRQRHGHARRPGGVPRLPAGLRGPGAGLERHVPGRHALDRRARRRSKAIGLNP